MSTSTVSAGVDRLASALQLLAPMRYRFSGKRILAIFTVGVLLYLVLGPLLMLLLTSVEDTSAGVTVAAPIPWSLHNYRQVFLDPATYRVLGNTAVFVAGSMLIAFAVSLAFAFLIERTDLRLRNLIYVLLVAPSGIPVLILAIAWSLAANPSNGFLNLTLRSVLGLQQGRGPLDVYSLPGMIIVQGMALVPLTFLLVTASLRGINASLEEAASTSGAKQSTTLRKITFPLLGPAILGALVYELVTVIAVVDIPLILGLPARVNLLSTQIYTVTHPPLGLPDYGAGSAYGMLLLILAVAPLFIYNRMIGRSDSYATVSSRNYRPKLVRLGRWRPVALAAALGYIGVSFIIPLGVLVWSSVQPFYAGLNLEALHRASFASYGEVWSNSLTLSSLRNTLLLGVSSALCAVLLSVFTSWLIVRSRSRLRWALDTLAFMPHAFPAVVIGLSTLLVYLVLPIPIYGTIWIVVIAMATQFVSLGTRLMTGSIAQIQRSLEEAAETSGATGRQVWGRVLLPLLRPSFSNGFLLVFLVSVQNLTLPLMLYSPRSVVLSTLIWNRWDTGDGTSAAVLSVGVTVITVILAILLRSVTERRSAQ